MQDIFLDELKTLHPTQFVSKWLLERIPHVFTDDSAKYLQWRGTLGQLIGVDPCAIILTGSSGSGFSLNPSKNFKPFDSSSDIDVAVVSSYHFEVGWRYLRTLGSHYYKLNHKSQRAADEHRTSYVYFGTIATDKLLEHLPFGKEWLSALSHMAGQHPTEGRDIKARIYRDFDSLRGYHLSNVRKLSADLLSKKETQESP